MPVGTPSLTIGQRRRRSLISLTPLIDVVFILLVFFMLASSFFDWRAVTLAPLAEGVEGTGKERAILIELYDDGSLAIDGRSMPMPEVEGQMRNRLQPDPERQVLVRPLPGADLQALVDTLDRLRTAGARNISLSPVEET